MKKLAEYFVHRCELDPELDIIAKEIKGDTRRARLMRCLRRHFTISFKNLRARRAFKSTYAMDLERTRHIKMSRHIIHPFSDFRQNWEIFMTFAYVFSMIMIPYYIGFIFTDSDEWEVTLYAGLDFLHFSIFLPDIIVNFITGYVPRKDEVVLLPWRIGVHYILTYFLWDLLACIPFNYILGLFASECVKCEYVVLLRLARYTRIGTIQTYIYRTADAFGTSLIITEVLWQFGRFLLFTHLLAGLMYALAWLTMPYVENSWLQIENVTTHRYEKSFFRASCTLLTTGYGVRQPESIPDKLLTIFAVFFGIVMCIILVGKILQWILILNASTSKYEMMMQHLHDYMRNKQLPLSLRRRLIDYYEYRFHKTYFKEGEILSSLSTQLRQEIVMYTCRRLVENVSFFNHLPSSLLLRIVVCLRAEMFLPNDVIVKAGTVGDCMFFITSGTVAVYTVTGKEVCHLEDGAHFGEIALVMAKQVRVASVVAVECSEAYRLDRQDFARAIAPYPDLVARVERVAEDRLERTTQMDEVHRRSIRVQEGRDRVERLRLRLR